MIMLVLFLFYSLLLELVYFLLSPVLFAVFRSKPGSERLAIGYPRKHYDILVHAASVGEINGIKQLLIDLLETHKEIDILLTTNTKTGRNAALNIHPRLQAIISPLDVYHLRVKQMMFSRPSLILITETEIWPTMLFLSRIKSIPIIYINARMSEKTFEKYLGFKPLLKWLGKEIKEICAQTETDKERFCAIFDTSCHTSGNLKFSVKLPLFDKESLRKEWGYKNEDKIVVIGSSRPGEEELILKAYDELKKEFTDLKLIIVPRHLKRLDEVLGILAHRSISRYTRNEPLQDIHVIDEMGHLLAAYALSDLAVIGGSFYPFGGHNPLEAAFYSLPIVMGPHHKSCLGSVSKLKEEEAIVISSAQKLTSDLRHILNNYIIYKQMGNRAKQVLNDNNDSLLKHLHIIQKYLD
jgi:3-deoxy-D-manno-octulosonic-acid transferase